ncbi:hypothetical protein Lal_00009315 [Lupinus albus]|nr:hypothetical protein Lal_00009315 [Lupinus albus]
MEIEDKRMKELLSKNFRRMILGSSRKEIAKEILSESRGSGPKVKESCGGTKVSKTKLRYKRRGKKCLQICKGVRKTRNLDQVKCIKDGDEKVLVNDKDMKKIEELFLQAFD